MKIFYSFLPLFIFFTSACGKERTFTGSTPANYIVRKFLDIPLTDSVDFIRWKLIISNDIYELEANYGLGKPNTKEFINGGSVVALKGLYLRNNNVYQFLYGSKTLEVVEINGDLLHLLDKDKSLMVGNSGWSYTLNNIHPMGSGQVSLRPSQIVLLDSIAFEGRTPCHVPGVVPPGGQCYKLKWSIVFYAGNGNNQGSFYKVMVTPWRQEGGRRGTWKMVSLPGGRTVYQLSDERVSLFLLKLDEGVMVFTDAGGKLLVGNEDFSYTLNARK
jgi:hypothetical protein